MKKRRKEVKDTRISFLSSFYFLVIPCNVTLEQKKIDSKQMIPLYSINTIISLDTPSYFDDGAVFHILFKYDI